MPTSWVCNKAVIYDLLFKAAAEATLTIAADPKHLGARIGITRDLTRRIAGRFAATVSILVWCGILFAGRWIAYTQAG